MVRGPGGYKKKESIKHAIPMPVQKVVILTSGNGNLNRWEENSYKKTEYKVLQLWVMTLEETFPLNKAFEDY